MARSGQRPLHVRWPRATLPEGLQTRWACALTIQRLRQKAKAELGEKFDIRDFHAQVLMTGSLPMPVLEKKIDDWIAAKGTAVTAVK